MKRHILSTALLGATLFTPVLAHATVMSLSPTSNPPSNDGLTYTLFETNISPDGLTANFEFDVTGYNTASDLQGGVNAGRASVEAFAFNQPSPGTVVSGSVTAPPGFNFVLGGLNSTGCNGNGNFFCFDNMAAPSTPPLAPGTLTFDFSVTANTAGVWANYVTDMKINWLGSANNYSLISQPIPVNMGSPPPPPPPPPPPVPEPWSIAILGVGFAGIGLLRRQRRS